MTIFKVINWAKSKLLTGPSWGSKTKGQLGPINKFETLRTQFSFYEKRAETPIFIAFWQTLFLFTNLAQLLTLKMAKLGPVNNSIAYIYIYMYI